MVMVTLMVMMAMIKIMLISIVTYNDNKLAPVVTFWLVIFGSEGGNGYSATSI